MITEKEIAKMKDGVILINCARGGLYNEEALYNNLKNGKIRFAGIDVFNKEPATNHPLLDLNNVTVTPHLGANTKESQQKIAIQAATQALEAVKGISYPNALNLPIKDGDTPEYVKPYLELIQKLGFIAGQANKGAISSIKITAQGEIEKYIDSLAVYATLGALKHSIGENINYVNAEYVAKEKDIIIDKEIKADYSGYSNKISVKITTDYGVVSICGTVFEDNKLRIIDINGFELDIEPTKNMILFKNSDVPGVIGEVGMTLAKHNINIADFRLGRNNNNEALAIIIVDEKIDNEIIEELSKLKACLDISYVII
jgi:D-3-phosphoglycerate dehydrogenase